MPDIRRTEFTRLYNPRGRPVVAHLATSNYPLCDSGPRDLPPGPGNWHGTGSYQEAERAKTLPLCPKCTEIASYYGWHDEMGLQLPAGGSD